MTKNPKTFPNQKIRPPRDLAGKISSYIEQNALTPFHFAKHARISNHTVKRLLSGLIVARRSIEACQYAISIPLSIEIKPAFVMESPERLKELAQEITDYLATHKISMSALGRSSGLGASAFIRIRKGVLITVDLANKVAEALQKEPGDTDTTRQPPKIAHEDGEAAWALAAKLGSAALRDACNRLRHKIAIKTMRAKGSAVCL